MKNQPTALSLPEWREIMGIEEVKEGWGLEDDITPEMFSEMVYGAKFDFTSGSPGYYGELFVITGDSLEPPLLIIRKNGVLQVTG